MVKLENILKDRNRKIEELANEKRNLEKIKMSQDRELDDFQKEYGYEQKVNRITILLIINTLSLR